MHVFIVSCDTLWFQREIKKLVDNLQLKYSHLSIMQVSFIIIKHFVKLHYKLKRNVHQPVIERKQVFHTLVYVYTVGLSAR